MPNVCILTDGTAQFPTPTFAGRNLVNVLPIHVKLGEEAYPQNEGIKANRFPPSIKDGSKPAALPPSVDEFQSAFITLSERYSEIVTLVLSSKLSHTYANALEAASQIQGHSNIQVIDSKTTSIGLGLLAQAASEAAEAGKPAAEIEREVRNLMPQLYATFCIEGLTYLQNSGYLGTAQALVGEYLKVMPLYLLDNGTLVPTQKIRNHRHLVDLLHEFLCEFTDLKHIGLLQGAPPYEQESRALRERIAVDFPNTPVSEHTMSAALATILGPRSLGLFVMQG